MNIPATATATATASSRPSLAWDRAADAICAVALLALWLVSRPYRGIRHDAILYAGQVLARLMPDRVGADLFFAYGSQDKYSLFSPLMAPIAQRFSIGPAEFALLLLCNVLFAIACWSLIRPWFSRPVCWAATYLVAGLPHVYGGQGAFSYAETFLTARSFAEPLALLALSQLLRGRLAIAIAAGLLAIAFHPLIALPALVIGWAVLVQQSRSWMWASLLFVVPLALALAGIAPFNGLLQTYDAAWFAVIRGPDQKVFFASAGVLDWTPLAFDVLVLLLGLRVDAVQQTLRRLILAVLVTVAAFTVVWGLGADVAHNVLLTQLQLWRAYWVLHLLGMALLPTVAVAWWQRGWVGRWCVAALGLAGVAVLSNWETSWLCIGWALLALTAEFFKTRISRMTVIAAIAASGLGMLLISARVMILTQRAVYTFPDRFGHVPLAMILVGLPVVAAALALGFVRLVAAGGPARAVAAAAAVAGVIFGAGVWDQRSAWQLRIEADPRVTTPPFETAISAGASVYWDGSLVEPWLLARRANFYDPEQGAGLLFNRQTAIEFSRRERAVSGFELQRELCVTIAALTSAPGHAPPACPLTPESVVEVCHATPHPDFLVFAALIDLPEVEEWQETVVGAADGTAPHAFHLYSCAGLH